MILYHMFVVLTIQRAGADVKENLCDISVTNENQQRDYEKSLTKEKTIDHLQNVS